MCFVWTDELRIFYALPPVRCRPDRWFRLCAGVMAAGRCRGRLERRVQTGVWRTGGARRLWAIWPDQWRVDGWRPGGGARDGSVAGSLCEVQRACGGASIEAKVLLAFAAPLSADSRRRSRLHHSCGDSLQSRDPRTGRVREARDPETGVYDRGLSAHSSLPRLGRFVDRQRVVGPRRHWSVGRAWSDCHGTDGLGLGLGSENCGRLRVAEGNGPRVSSGAAADAVGKS